MSLGDGDEKGGDVRIVVVSPQALVFTAFPGEVLLEDNMPLVSVGEEANLLVTAVAGGGRRSGRRVDVAETRARASRYRGEETGLAARGRTRKRRSVMLKPWMRASRRSGEEPRHALVSTQ